MPKVECECLECGKKFFRYPSDIKVGGGKYCSHSCHSKWLCGENNPMFGKPRSEDVKKKISTALKGHIVSDETKKKLCLINTGKTLSEEHKKKLSFRGRHHTEETKKRLSLSKSGENNPNFGKPMSEETKKKLSLSLSGENNPNFGKHPIVSEETKKKMSLSHSGEKNHNFGKPMSEEQKKKISNGNKGKIFTEEARKKISMSNTGKLRSEEQKKKMRGENHPMFGKHPTVSEETKIKISESNKGRKQSEDHRMKNTEFRVGGFWYGNVKNDYTIRELIRGLLKFKIWVGEILKRDEYKDYYTGEICKHPEVHHLIQLSDLIKKYKIKTLDDAYNCKELWDINNGITLEKENHIKLHGYRYGDGGKIKRL